MRSLTPEDPPLLYNLTLSRTPFASSGTSGSNFQTQREQGSENSRVQSELPRVSLMDIQSPGIRQAQLSASQEILRLPGSFTTRPSQIPFQEDPVSSQRISGNRPAWK